MDGKIALITPLALLLFANNGLAAGRLSDAQLDRVTAGDVSLVCSNCGTGSSSASSISANGITTSTSSSTPGGGNSGGAGSTGGGGSNGGSNNGGSSGNNSGGGSGSSGPGVVFSVPIPASIAAVINLATVIHQ